MKKIILTALVLSSLVQARTCMDLLLTTQVKATDTSFGINSSFKSVQDAMKEFKAKKCLDRVKFTNPKKKKQEAKPLW